MEGPERENMHSLTTYFLRGFLPLIFFEVPFGKQLMQKNWICVKKRKEKKIRRGIEKRRCTVWWSVKLEASNLMDFSLVLILVGFFFFFLSSVSNAGISKKHNLIVHETYPVVFLAHSLTEWLVFICISVQCACEFECENMLRWRYVWIAWKLERWELDKLCVCAPISSMYAPKKGSDFLQFDLHFSSFPLRFHRFWTFAFLTSKWICFWTSEFSSGFVEISKRIFVCPAIDHTCTLRYTMANTAETRLLDYTCSSISFSLFSSLKCIFIVSNKFNVKLSTTTYISVARAIRCMAHHPTTVVLKRGTRHSRCTRNRARKT